MSEHSCVLIESPGWRDASFYGEWLVAAAKAQRLWREAVESDCKFRSRIERLEVVRLVQLDNEALEVIGKITAGDACTLIVRIDSELGDSVALMAGMGFFALTGDRYQMVLPSALNDEIVRGAALALAATEDAEYYIHPEDLLRVMPLSSGQRWQNRLQRMDEQQRLADRELLLSD